MNHDIAISCYREHQRITFERILAANIDEEAELHSKNNADAKTVNEALKLRVAINAMQNGLKGLGGGKRDHCSCELCSSVSNESENL
ncbi:hypothetical protein GCM10011585_12910 [Edaphobacter dinghuensis]|uniref:Uncharacterized protein n=1 Tax=Edaphobacter dinghuensis TaxID=1560005 RepID=A0A917H964_9BACT|nr:hypothetical protein GCM10011585_12910 [Edaphobacter dinghuensis]